MSVSVFTRTSLECIPCLGRATLDAVRSATLEPALQEAVLGEALFHLAMRDPAWPPATLAEDLRRLIAARTGHDAPDFYPLRHCARAGWTTPPFPP